MQKFELPYRIQAKDLTSARLEICSACQLESGMSVPLTIARAAPATPIPADGPDEYLLTTTTELPAGVWRLRLAAACGCWSQLVSITCPPVGSSQTAPDKRGAMGGTYSSSVPSSTLIPSCDPETTT